MTDMYEAPSYDWVAEQSLLGALLVDNSAWDRICDRMRPDQLGREDSRLIFGAITRLIDAGQPADAVTVAMDLEARDELRQVGGLMYIHSLIAAVPGASSIVRYADLVAAQARLRGGMAIANTLFETLNGPNGRTDPVGALHAAAAELEALADDDAGDDQTLSAEELARRTLLYVDEVFNRGGDGLPTVPTGLADLDAALCGGASPGDLVLIAGRPAMGKSVLGLTIADHIATPGHRNGGMVLVFSMEMSPDQHGQRQASANASVSLSAIRKADLPDREDWDRLSSGVQRISRMRQLVDFRPALSVSQVRAKARKVKRKHGLAAIVVDYLQLMQARAENRNQEISQISAGLKAIAKELRVPVFALAQLNRSVEGRANKRPMMSDLRDSGSLEQDADTVLLLYRDEYYSPDSPDKGIVEIIIGKQRMGECQTVRAQFQGQYSRMVDLAHDWRPAPRPESKTKKKWDGANL